MHSRSFILVAVTVAVLIGLAAGVYAYDRAREDEISEGVRVGGVDIGGLSPERARAKLEASILDPLQQPIVVRRGDRRWTLGPREARINADLGAMVDEALARSRSGGILDRTWRGLTGERVEADLRPTVRFSSAAVVRLLDRVRRDVEHPATDAKVSFSASGPATTPGHDGLAVQAKDLHHQIRAAIVSPQAGRTFTAHTHRVQPKVTTKDLAHRYPAVLVVDRKAFKLTFFKDLKPAKTYGIAVGQVGLETPAGLYNIQNKAINPAWHVPDSDWAGKLRGKVIPGDDPTNPIKARWMGIYDGAGIHGTDAEGSIGSAASHGCIRMRIPEVKELYDEVPVGAPVYIS